MELVVALEYRFDCTPDGAVWTQTVGSHSFWTRYLEVFDHVRILARIHAVPRVSDDFARADGDGVSFIPVPYYIGPWQYGLAARRVKSVVARAVRTSDAVVLRVPGQLGSCTISHLARSKRPFGLEVVGDPYDVLAPGAVKHPLRPFFRWWFTQQLKVKCKQACAVAYVTQRALQSRYPPSPRAYCTHYSSIELPDSAFASSGRAAKLSSRRYTFVTVGSLAQPYKATDILIDACRILAHEGLDFYLVVIGDGKFRTVLEARAERHGLKSRIRFLGQLPAGDSIRLQLDQADIFILPSRQEGLPRAMIEAMARGLPCIGSKVGGIPELLWPEDLVPPNDVHALATKILEFVRNPRRMTDASARNLVKAREYREEILRERRLAFYRQIRSATAEWIKERRA